MARAKNTAQDKEVPADNGLTRVAVWVKKPHTHRRRAGMAFGQQVQTISVTADVLDALVNDPLLVVELLTDEDA